MHDTDTVGDSGHFYLHGRCTKSKGSLVHYRFSQVSATYKNIINPIMREILMRCDLKSDSNVIIRVILPVVESWSWTEACSVAEKERKCCYACRSCSHLCLNQWLYIICFFLQRDFQLAPFCCLCSTSLLDKVDWAQGPEARRRKSDKSCFRFHTRSVLKC